MLKIRCFALCMVIIAAAKPDAEAAAPAPSGKTSAEKQAQLIATLRSEAPPAEKAIACKQLAIYGTGEAVPALAPLLADEQLASWARIALEAIPGPEANDALRAALKKLHGKLLVGVINSIGVRRDTGAHAGLIDRLKDADSDVASAAAAALGHIAGPIAANLDAGGLTGAFVQRHLQEALVDAMLVSRRPEVRAAAAEGCILCAEGSLAAGDRKTAVGLYDQVRKADVPKQRTIEATRGAILARGAEGVPLLVEQLRSADKALFAAGLQIARELPGREAADALAAELGRASPERQALLILTLADRGDAAALPAVLEAAKGGSGQVRLAAIAMMERVANASCTELLVEIAISDDQGVAQRAKDVLSDMRDPNLDKAVVGWLGTAAGKTRQTMIELAGLRHITAASPALLKDADDPDASIRVAALTALGFTIEQNDLPALIVRAVQPKDSSKPDEEKAAMDALRLAAPRMADHEACAAKLIAAAAQAPVPTRCNLLEVLTAVGGSAALQAVAAAARDADADVQDAGTRLLGQWMTADAAPVLLDLAKTAADAKYKTRALRGYLRIARQFAPAGEPRVAMCRQAWPLCQRAEEKKLVVEALRTTPSAESLALVTAQLGDPALKQEAAAAAVAIAERIVYREPQAVADAMKKVLAASAGGAPAIKARSLLDTATAEIDRK